VALCRADEFGECGLAHGKPPPLGADTFANLFGVKWHGVVCLGKGGWQSIATLDGQGCASCYCPPVDTLHEDGSMVDINGGHPFWGILRIAVIFCGLTLFLYLNATQFDKGEMTTILELLLVVGGFEVLKKKIQNGGGKKKSG
jgi:hypothetical protein